MTTDGLATSRWGRATQVARTRWSSIASERERSIDREVRDDRTAAILGIALGVAFTVCFVTGLISHLIQHPPSWFAWPARPVGLYRVSQGVHVATGIASVPLLLAKLWAVYPRLFRGPRRDVGDVLARMSLVPLVGGSLFMLVTGVGNIERWYPWPFFFPRAHFWVAWITIGALIVHVGAQVSTTRAALSRANPIGGVTSNSASGADVGADEKMVRSGMSRRGFMTSVAAATGALTLTTAGQTWSPLRRLVLFAQRRPDIGSQGLPVNQAAADAHVEKTATDPEYQLVVEIDGHPAASWSLRQLEAMPKRAAKLPISCVEGWSADARWSGIAVRDLLARAGVTHLDGRSVEVVSLEANGLYGRSTLSSAEAMDRDTLLALEVNDERLNLDHGYPIRLIAPNRPGVMQTKWVHRLLVSR